MAPAYGWSVCWPTQGFVPQHIPATILDVALPAGQMLKLDTIPGQTAFLFTILGAVTVAGQAIGEKSAVLFEDGRHIAVQAAGGDARFLFFMAPPLQDPIAWGGPIVMNTHEELELAFRQLRRGLSCRADPSVKSERKFSLANCTI